MPFDFFQIKYGLYEHNWSTEKLTKSLSCTFGHIMIKLREVLRLQHFDNKS